MSYILWLRNLFVFFSSSFTASLSKIETQLSSPQVRLKVFFLSFFLFLFSDFLLEFDPRMSNVKDYLRNIFTWETLIVALGLTVFYLSSPCCTTDFAMVSFTNGELEMRLIISFKRNVLVQRL